MNKALIRNNMIEKLSEIDLIKHNQLSLLIKNRVITSPEFIEADVIGITLSRFPEVDTRGIIEAAWEHGKSVVVPKCTAKTRAMDFRLIESFEELETVYMDLLEPIVSKTKLITKENIDLQIVPGDRYMESFTGKSIALAFEVQTEKAVPVESHDIPVEKIITENTIQICTKVESVE